MAFQLILKCNYIMYIYVLKNESILEKTKQYKKYHICYVTYIHMYTYCVHTKSILL